MRKKPNPLTTVAIGLIPWPAVWIGLYQLHSVVWAFALYHSACFLLWRIAGNPLPPVPKVVWKRRQWTILGAACLVINFGVYLLAGLIAKLLQPERITDALKGHGIGSAPLDLFALFAYFAIANPIFEELFWRGTIHERLREANWTPRFAATVSGILFGAWHWLPIRLFFVFPESIVITVGIMMIGVVLGLFYDRNRSVPATILLHALGADVPILLMLYLDVGTR